MKSSFFYGGHCKRVAELLKSHINEAPDFLSAQTAGSTRAAGDAIEGLIAEQFDLFLGDCLTVGALGWGQIQIANSNRIVLNDGYSRKAWMLSLCNAMLEFYPKEILKIQGRVSRFEEVKTYWERKLDVWANQASE